jgi:4-diphosphocytidyl-2-C-methyl-D-erythritol kinase
MSIHRALAPAKVNLGLFLGPRRPEDGRHELATVMQSISLADELTLEPAGAGAASDEVHCPGVDGPVEENLALRALKAFRGSTGWDAPPQRLRIEKRIPVAAGLGGGSADAAAALRLARHASGLGDEPLLLELAAGLGADVPAQVTPGCWLATGAGEVLQRLADPGDSFALLILPSREGLSTAAVFQEADRLGIPRDAASLSSALRLLEEAWAEAVPRLGRELIQNDLQQPAVLLCPGILDLLTRARERGSDLTLISGSGPTVLGLFTGTGTAGGEGHAGVQTDSLARAHARESAQSDTQRARMEGIGRDSLARARESVQSETLSPASPPIELDALERARTAAESLAGLVPPAIFAHPVDAAFARPWTLEGS